MVEQQLGPAHRWALGQRGPWRDTLPIPAHGHLALLAVLLITCGTSLHVHAHKHHDLSPLPPLPPLPNGGSPLFPGGGSGSSRGGGSGGGGGGGGGGSWGGGAGPASPEGGATPANPGSGDGGNPSGGGVATHPSEVGPAQAGGATPTASSESAASAGGQGGSQGGGSMQAAETASEAAEGIHTFTMSDRIYGIRGGGGGDPVGTIDMGQPLQGASIYYDTNQAMDIGADINSPRMGLAQGDAEPGDPQVSNTLLFGLPIGSPAVTPIVPTGQTVTMRPQGNTAAARAAFPHDFPGLTASDNIAVNQKLTEPPDLSLCTGNGIIVELVNSAYAFYAANTGDRIGGPYSLYKLFSVPTTASMTDPGCIFDSQDSQRFYISIQWYEKYKFSYQIIVVSKTSDPRDGFNGVFAVDTSGTAPGLGFDSCVNNGGCLGDYPTYGMDSAAFWFAVNAYTFTGSRLAGAILYGVRKADLLSENAQSRPQVIVFKNFTVYNIKMGFTVQPANTQAGTPYDMRNGGTQYAISSASFYRTNVSSLVTWVIHNTSIIAQNFPGGQNPYVAGVAVIPTQGLNSPSHQFGESIAQVRGAAVLDSKDERMQQVVWGGGFLWTNMQTALIVGDAGPSSAVAWFKIFPQFTPEGVYNPIVAAQGYARVAGNNVINGAMAANALGDGICSFSIVGANYNYSAAYMLIPRGYTGAGPDLPLVITKLGENPLFGFSRPIRNGDYTNAIVGDNGTFWVAAQYAVGQVYTTSSGYKQNWGTFIAQVVP